MHEQHGTWIGALYREVIVIVGGESVARIDANLAAIHPVRRIQAHELGRGAAVHRDIDGLRRHLAPVEQKGHTPPPRCAA